MVAGFSQEEVDKTNLPSVSDEELQAIVRKKLLGVQATDGNKQKVVSIREADEYLAKGWEYVAKLNDNKVVIKVNSTNP